MKNKKKVESWNPPAKEFESWLKTLPNEEEIVRRINSIKPGRLVKTEKQKKELEIRLRPYRTRVTTATMQTWVGGKKNYLDNEVIGGPSRGTERCPGCGRAHVVYRAGSWDYGEKKCKKCCSDDTDARLSVLNKRTKLTLKQKIKMEKRFKRTGKNE